MSDCPPFNSRGECHLNDSLNNDVVLKKSVWDDHLTEKPDRHWYVYNWEDIKKALSHPDEKRRSEKHRECVLWYRKVERVVISKGITVPRQGYWCVVVRYSKEVMTVYFTIRIKEGDRI
jgi:hypothetical protein